MSRSTCTCWRRSATGRKSRCVPATWLASSAPPAVYPRVATALRLATLRGAEVLDMAAQIGSLAPGKQADVIVLNPHTLNFAPRFDDVSQVVFNAQPGNVEWVFVDGRVLKERGKLVGVDAEAVIADANHVAQRV